MCITPSLLSISTLTCRLISMWKACSGCSFLCWKKRDLPYSLDPLPGHNSCLHPYTPADWRLSRQASSGNGIHRWQPWVPAVTLLLGVMIQNRRALDRMTAKDGVHIIEEKSYVYVNDSNVKTSVNTLKKLRWDMLLRFQSTKHVSWFDNPLSSWLPALISPLVLLWFLYPTSSNYKMADT